MAKTFTKLQSEIDHLHAQLREAETREAARIGKLAQAAKATNLDLTDAQWREIFAEVVRRFQASDQAKPARHPRRKTAQPTCPDQRDAKLPPPGPHPSADPMGLDAV